MVLLFLFFLPLQVVGATDSVDLSLKSDLYEVRGNQEITVTLDISNYIDINKGINVYKATVDYDTDVFEEVKASDFSCFNNWESLKYNPLTKELVVIRRSGSKVPGALLSLRLKVKENVLGTNALVSFKDMVFSEGKRDLVASNESVLVQVINNQSSISDNTINNSYVDSYIKRANSLVDKMVNKLYDNDVLSESGTFKTISDTLDKNDNILNYGGRDNAFKSSGVKFKELVPKKKDISFWFIFIIVMVFVYSIYFLIKKLIRKDNYNYIKKMLLFIIVSFLFLSVMRNAFALVINFNSLGELNGDGEVNYKDVELLELYLIHQQQLGENYLVNVDMNSDGKITVTDLSLLIQELEKTLDYEVSLYDASLENYYYHKNASVELLFNSYVKFGAKIVSVVMDGNEYLVSEIPGTQTYKLRTNVGNKSGIRTFNITEVKLDNDKRVKVDHSIKIDVLKDIPAISNYKIEENIYNEEVSMIFDLVDKDNSVTSANVVVYNEQSKVFYETEINSGKNNVKLTIPDSSLYKVNFIVKYDLSSKKLDNDSDYSNSLIIDKELQLNINYNFKLRDIKAYKNGVVAGEFEKGKDIFVGFLSTNSTIYEPKTVKINGKFYNVLEKDGNRYFVIMDSFSEVGCQDIKIEEVILTNGKVFKIKDNDTISVDIVKRRPSLFDFHFLEDSEKDMIDLGFNLKDLDNSLKGVDIYLFDDNGIEVFKYSLTKEEILSSKIRKTLKNFITDKYRVKVVAQYIKNKDLVETVLLDREIQSRERVKIVDVDSNKKYFEKGELVNLSYQIETNKIDAISKIVVNNTEYAVTKLSNGNYQIQVELPRISGIRDLVTSKVIFSDGVAVDVFSVMQVEVLKDHVGITNYSQVDDTSKGSVAVNFDLDDLDDAFISGKAFLTKIEDNTSQVFDIKKGENNLILVLDDAKQYKLEIKVSYDRDTNLMDTNSNFYNDYLLGTYDILLLSDYKISISNIKTFNKNSETKYFEANQPIILTFESSNISNFKPVKAVINGEDYDLLEVDYKYQVQLNGFDKASVNEIIINKIFLSNTVGVNILENNSTKVEILKSRPKVSNFSYTENDDSTISAQFILNDKDNSIVDGSIAVVDQNGKNLKTQKLVSSKNTITFNKTNTGHYKLKVLANYDLDTNTFGNGMNEYNYVLLDEEINVSHRAIEMKDVSGIVLYKNTQTGAVRVDDVNISDLSILDNYIVQVNMKNLSSFYTTIKEYKIEKNKLKFILNYDNVVQYNGDMKNNQLEVYFGVVDGDVASSVDLNRLIELIRENPSGTYKINRDIDASDFTTNTAVIMQEFTGKIDFNGHKIINLSRPLFNTLSGATIENLVIEDANLSRTNSKDLIANTATNSIIRNVSIDGLTITGVDRSRGFIGTIN